VDRAQAADEEETALDLLVTWYVVIGTVVTVATVAIFETFRSINPKRPALSDHAVILVMAFVMGLCWPVVVVFTLCHRSELK
jgi:capsular polysaccharide biosynthesis protein